MLSVALEMMTVGMRVDLDALSNLSQRCLSLMQVEAEAVHTITGSPINPNSDTQVRELVYKQLGFKPTKLTKNKREASTIDKELSKVNHPVISHILEYRKIAKVRDSYCETLPRYAVKETNDSIPNPSGVGYSSGYIDVVHPNIRITGTETGRIKVTNPALQTLPVRTELGREVRGAFIARPGKVLLFCDLSQIEMRVLAHESRCKNLVTLFNSGGDIHTDTATKVFGVTREEATLDKYRKPIKNVNFGVVYGISAQGLHGLMVENGLGKSDDNPDGWTVKDCQQLITDYFTLYPEVRTFTQETVAFARRNGYVKSLMGRIRYIPELKCPFPYIQAEGERKAGNGPIQMGAQDIFKAGTNRIYQGRPAFGVEFKFLMQIHDELVLECEEKDVRALASWVDWNLCHTYEIDVPLLSEAKCGTSWGNAKELKEML